MKITSQLSWKSYSQVGFIGKLKLNKYCMIKQKTKMELFIYLRAWNVDDGLGWAYKSMYAM